MVIRLTQIKSLLWFLAILLLVLSFPLQVYTNSPYPSLLPYFVIMLIILLHLLFTKGKISTEQTFRRNRNINLMVNIYIFLVLFHTSWQTVFQVIGFSDAMNALAIYLLPVIFYWYFQRIAFEREIQWVLSAMVVGGLIVGLYFAYDSYLKLALHQISDYANAAFQYSLDRGTGKIEDANNARINLGSRSSGLLQSHTVSGAWVVLGAFAALALIPANFRVFRLAIVLVFGIMLLLGLNFSSIVAFIIIVFSIEYGGLSLFRGRLSRRYLINFVLSSLSFAIMVVAVLWVAGDAMSETILLIASIQRDIVFGMGVARPTIFGLIMETVTQYFRHILDSPLTLVLGDGFSTFGFAKGGDLGAIESLAQFGLPFYLAILLGLFSLIRTGLRRMKCLNGSSGEEKTDLHHSQIIQFAICVTMLILILDGHYSVWVAKSILPIVFFVLALYGRYLKLSSARRHDDSH